MNQGYQEMIRQWQDRIRETEERAAVRRYDLSDAEDKKRIEELTDEIFTQRINTFRDYDRRKNAITQNDWEHLVQKRRKQAILALCEEFSGKFSEIYPDLFIPEELIRLSAPAGTLTFDGLDQEYDVTLAAAICILDALMDSGAYEEAAAYFPKTRAELNQVYLPNLSDAVHSDDALRSMICLIRNRNRGMEGFDENKAFIDEAATGYRRKTSDADLPDRQHFDAVIALLDQESIARAQEQFIKYIRAFSGEVLKTVAAHRAALSEAVKAAQSELNALNAELSPLVNGKDDAAQVTVSGSEMGRRQLDAAKAEKLLSELQQKEADVERLYAMVQMIPAYHGGKAEDDRDAALFADCGTPEIRNPYEMCFAFLTLLDSNSDWVWLYNLCYDVLAFACQALPWADSGAVDPHNDLEEIQVDYEYLASLIEKTPDWDDNRMNELMYQKQLHSPLVTPQRQKISISQLAFLASGLIPPRQGNSISFTKAILHDAGLPAEQIALLYEYFSLAYSINHKDEEYVALEDDEADEAGESGDEQNAAEEIKELRAEIKYLKKAVHQLERRSKEAENRLAESEKEREVAIKELAELRTMIREASDEEETAVTVSFPYTAKKRSVIIGGHESWVKAIKPLLPDVRFISSSVNPNPGVILNAEVVWIQTNALGHSGYYKIIDIVRRNHIKVCYFSFASAEKCAEQFALEDMGEADPDAVEEPSEPTI